MEAKNLQNVFSEGFFRIPDYQRGYAWEERQLSELWDDIDEIIWEENQFKKHYTGTLFVEKAQPAEDEKWLLGATFYHVVDGQQRLTTISILLFELLTNTEFGFLGQKLDALFDKYLYTENNSGLSRIYKFSYSQENSNHAFLLNRIFGDDSVPINHIEINKYANNLITAKQFFRQKIELLTHEEKEKLFAKITTALHFDIRRIDEDLDVQAVFETINNRGKPLSVLEKLKNRLIYLSDKSSIAKEDRYKLRKKINLAWGAIYENLGKNPDFILDEDEFLSSHLSLYRKPVESVFSEKIAEEKVFQMFCNKPDKYTIDEGGKFEDLVSYHKIDNYISSLSEAAPIWYEIHNSKSILIKKILILNRSKDLKIFLVALIRHSNKNLDFDMEEFLYKIELILFRNRVVWLFDERSFANWARKIYNNVSMPETTSDVNDLVSHKIDEDEVVNAFSNLFTYQRGNKGFHRWPTLKYFLFEYDEKLRLKYNEASSKVNIDEYYETTIEHIIPQHYYDHWSEILNSLTEGMLEDEAEITKKVVLNSLGNLTILKNGKNSSLGNLGWREKKERFSTGSYNEINISKNEKWGKEEMYVRGQNLINYLEEKLSDVNFSSLQRDKLLYFTHSIIETVTKQVTNTQP